MKSIMLFILTFNYAWADLQLSGSANGCSGANAGSIRLKTSTTGLEFCDGTSWKNKADFAVPSGTIAFFAAACPSGWTEYTAARGRYIVGVPSGGTVAGTVGSALSNLQNRVAGSHTHTVDFPSTYSSYAPNHTHTYQGISSGTHGTTGNIVRMKISNGTSTPMQAAGNHSHAVNLGAFNSTYAGSVSGTNAPYVQLRGCRKS